MRRREFIAVVGGALVWPVAARAQQGERVRRIGVLMNLSAEDPLTIARANALTQGLHALGWIEGRNMHVDFRWADGKADLFHRYAQELAALGACPSSRAKVTFAKELHVSRPFIPLPRTIDSSEADCAQFCVVAHNSQSGS